MRPSLCCPKVLTFPVFFPGSFSVRKIIGKEADFPFSVFRCAFIGTGNGRIIRQQERKDNGRSKRLLTAIVHPMGPNRFSKRPQF